MNVVPLAADSLGVRSMATYVECGDTRIVIDPGASLAASRLNLPPAEEEWDALRRANERIDAYAARSQLIFVSHYHEDHFRYDPAIYRDRSVWAKDPGRMIGPRQAGRARTLWKALDRRCRLDPAEGRRLETPDAVLTASPPLSHGVDGTELGYVVALTVTDRREGTRFVHASDVQGPLSPVATAYLIRERPTLLYLSGPPAYLESQLGPALIDRGVESLLRIIEATGCRAIVDHHAVRALDYRERLDRLWRTGRALTAASLLGLPEAPLEARRHLLWAARRKAPAAAPMRTSRLSGGRGSVKMDGRARPERRREGTAQ
jgi:predicted metallo-beta-lactamase superfamily hydrolase